MNTMNETVENIAAAVEDLYCRREFGVSHLEVIALIRSFKSNE